MTESTPRAIILLSKARRAIAEARTVDEVKDIRDKGHAAIKYAKSRRDLGLDVQNDAAEIVLRAERKLGEMLSGAAIKGGVRHKSHDGTCEREAVLSENGITKNESSRWQSEARVPEPDFEAFLEATRAAGKQLTSGALVKLGKQQTNRHTRNTPVDTTGGVVGSLQDLIAAGRRFACIYADPPWRYGNQATRASTDNHYPTMTVEQIAAEPVAKVAADVCHLYLWTTAGFLPDAFGVIKAWGFTYKSNMVWVKPQMGIGNYVRLAHEHLLIAIRGNTRTDGKSQMSWIQANRTKHSRKPREFRDVVERMSSAPFLEMYGRESVDGWTVYGNQIEASLV